MTNSRWSDRTNGYFAARAVKPRAGQPDRFRIPQMHGLGQFVICHLSFVMALKGPSLGALALAQRKSC